MIKPWDEYFMEIAKTCASRSNCLRANVGAVIVGDDKKLRPQAITEPHPRLFLAMSWGIVIELKIILNQAQDMKPAAQSMPNKTL